MAGDLTSPFQGVQPIHPPRVATTLSREQFLYSLARTPSPARFQKPRSNCQVSAVLNTNASPGIETAPPSEQFLYSLSKGPSDVRFRQLRSNHQIHRGLNDPFQTGGIEDSVTRHPHDATGAQGFNTMEGPKSGPYSEPPEKNPVGQIDQSLGEANKRQNFVRNEAVTKIQRLAPTTEPRFTLRAAQVPTPTSERNSIGSSKRAVGIIASGIYSIPPSPPPLISVVPVELEEFNTPSNLRDESWYDSNGSSGDESGSLYTDVNMTLNGSGDSDHATAQSTAVRSYLDSNTPIRKPPQIEQDKSSDLYKRFRAADADRILPGRSKKLKRPNHFYSKTLAQDVALEAIQGGTAEKEAPGEICRAFNQLKVAEERAVQKTNPEAGEVLSDDNSSIIESQLTTGDVLFDDNSPMIEGQPASPEAPLLSVRQKRFPESSPQKPRKKPKKTYPNTKMVSSRIHFKDLTLINRGSIPPAGCPKPIPTRLDFCDGFVGEESQPIGRTKAPSRPRRLPRPGMLRLAKGYACQLPLVQSRVFGVEPSVQEENRRNAPISITCESNQTGEFIIVGDGRMVSHEDHQVPTKEIPTKGTSNSNAALHGGFSGAPFNGSNVYYSKKESGRSTVGDKSEKRKADLKERVGIQFGSEPFEDDPYHGQKEQRGSTCDVQQGRSIPSQPTVWQTKQARQVFDGDQESTTNYRTSSIIEDVDMDVDPSPQSEESDNDGSFSDSPLLDMSPATSTFKRRVTFNEDVEVIRQQLAMVSAPLPVSTASSEDGSDSDHMDEDDEDAHNDGSDSHASESGDADDEDARSEGSEGHASENGSEVGSSADEHSVESASPRHNHRSLYTTFPSTPIRRWASTGVLGSSSGGGFETEMLDDDMILDDTASMTPKKQVSDTVHLWSGKSYDDKGSILSPSCPWAPRRPALPRHSAEDDGGNCASPSSRVPRKKTVNNIRLNLSQMDWSSTHPNTPMPHVKTRRRAPSVELGDPDWQPRSFYSQSIVDSQASGVVDLNHQSKKFMVANVPSYFSAASQNFNQPLYGPTVPLMRSKSMPMRSKYFEKGHDWSADENISSDSMFAGKFASFFGGQDEGSTGLRALTRHISIGFGTPNRRRRNPSLPFRPPLKHI